jgi:hypothetical protein
MEDKKMEAKVYYMGWSLPREQRATIHDPIHMKASFPEIDGQITMEDFRTYWKLLGVVNGYEIDTDVNLEKDIAICEWCFDKFQGENWSPNGEARPIIRAMGITHTSMSVGDCVEIVDDEGHKTVYICENEGWRVLK